MKVATLNLNLDNTQRQFQYRKGTEDEAVIVQELKHASYNFGPLRRASELAELYRRLTQTGKAPLVVDAGAKIGASTVYFAHQFPKARLVALESDKSRFDLLTANTAGLSVECMHAAVAASAENAQPVPRITINEIYRRNEQDAIPFMVKLDIDSSENGLFAASTEWVNRTPIIIVALHDCLIPGTENSRAFVEYIADCNRDFVYLNDNIFSTGRGLRSMTSRNAD